MAKTCKIVKASNGKVNGVLDQSNNPSTLFKQILNTPTLSLDESILAYQNVYGQKLRNKVQFQTIEQGSSTPQITQELIDRLKQTGLADNVYQLSTEEINAKLKELGISEDVRKQVTDYINGYYSNADVAFTNLKDKNPKNVKGWISQLTDTQKNGGVKNVSQELEWIGLEDYLNEYVKENNPKAGNIPSSVVEDYIKSNQIEIIDVSKGTSSDDMSKVEVRDEFYNEAREQLSSNNMLDQDAEETLDIWYANPTSENFQIVKSLLNYANIDLSYIYDKNSNEINNVTKYSGYQLKGAENYREILLIDNKIKSINTLRNQAQRDGNFELVNYYDEQVVPNMGQSYSSSHWDESNILAHVRLNEKTLPDGRKVLIINEIQSDWAQDGRKKGFKDGIKEKEIASQVESIDKNIREKENKMAENKSSINDEMSDAEYETIRTENKTLRSEVDVLNNERKGLMSQLSLIGDVPNMPYKNTDQWVGLVTRKVMQMASKEGYSGIAFATGAQSADMYSLSKSVDYIKKQPESFPNKESNSFDIFISMPNGTLSLEIDKTTGVILGQTGNARSEYTGKNLEDVTGKEMSKKLISLDENEHILKGEDLEIGGEGMKAFYDKILPKVVQKEAQRFDKNAKLETVDFSAQPLRVETDEDGNKILVDYTGEVVDAQYGNRFKTDQEYIEAFQDGYNNSQGITINKDKLSLGVQPYLPLTKTIKDSVEQGIPQFQKALGINLITNGFVYSGEVFLNKDTITEETPIHEFSHLYNSYLKQNRPELYNRGIDLVKEELGKSNSEIQDIIDYVKTTQPNLKGEAFQEEILAELTGRKGVEMLNSKKSSGIIDWLKEFFAEIGNFLGLTSMTPQQVANLSLGEYTQATIKDLMSGDVIAQERIQTAIQRNNGNPLNLTPNGKASILYQSYKDLEYSDSEAERLTAQVYSDSFLDFFGDWLNSPENASKVVDENGMPMIVYHGTNNKFFQFNINKLGEATGNLGWFGAGFYFAQDKKMAKGYADNASVKLKKILTKEDYTKYMKLSTNEREEGYDYLSLLERVQDATDKAKSDSTIIQSFLNIRNPQIEDIESTNNWGENFKEQKKTDGAIVYVNTNGIYEIVARNPNQIKSATENTGEFSNESNDIRYQKIIEPNLSFQTPTGENFNTYQEALNSTGEGKIKLNIEDITIAEVDSDTNIDTFEGTINHLVKTGGLTGERVLEHNGDIVYITQGNSLTKKQFTANLVEEQAVKLLGGSSVKRLASGDFILVDNLNKVTIAGEQFDKKDIDALDFNQLKTKFGEQTALRIELGREYTKALQPTKTKKRLDTLPEVKEEDELVASIKSLLNKLGIKITSIEDYVKNNTIKNNDVAPTADALMDIVNKVMAFRNGEITRDDLIEETMHLIEASWGYRNIHRFVVSS